MDLKELKKLYLAILFPLARNVYRRADDMGKLIINNFMLLYCAICSVPMGPLIQPAQVSMENDCVSVSEWVLSFWHVSHMRCLCTCTWCLSNERASINALPENSKANKLTPELDYEQRTNQRANESNTKMNKNTNRNRFRNKRKSSLYSMCLCTSSELNGTRDFSERERESESNRTT